MAQINKPGEHFNTVLYTGNGNTNTGITGVGFKPDWTWIKSRNSGSYNNFLFDIIRGATKYMKSDAISAQNTLAESLKSFDSDGFTVGTEADVNNNTTTYAAWNWKAAGSSPSNTYVVKVVSDSGNKYRFDDFGTSAVTLELSEGGTYTFDQSDNSNSGHPIRFSTTSDGTHGGGSEYTTGVTTNGTPGQSGAYTRITVAASAPTLYYYCTQHSGMGGQANTPTTNSFSNFDGSIQSNVSPNSDSLFSIVKYTASGSNATIGHGLGTAPAMVIVKGITTENNWRVGHDGLTSWTYRINLESTAAESSQASVWNSTAPTSSVFSIGTSSSVNDSGVEHIAYCFAPKKGFFYVGEYEGNASNEGPFCWTGFKPAMVMIKNRGATGNWTIADNKRSSSGGTNVLDERLFPSDPQAASTGFANIDTYSNGFKVRQGSDGGVNSSGVDYIFAAWAESPLVGTNNIPTTAR